MTTQANSATPSKKLLAAATALASNLRTSADGGYKFIADTSAQCRGNTPRADFADQLYDLCLAQDMGARWAEKSRKTRFRYASAVGSLWDDMDYIVTKEVSRARDSLATIDAKLAKRLGKSGCVEKTMADMAKVLFEVDNGKGTEQDALDKAQKAAQVWANQKMAALSQAHKNQTEHGIGVASLKVFSAIVNMLSPSKDGTIVTMDDSAYAAFVRVASICAGVAINEGLITPKDDKGKAWTSKLPRSQAEGAGDVSYADAKTEADISDVATVQKTPDAPEPKAKVESDSTPLPTAPAGLDMEALANMLMLRMKAEMGK